MVKVKDYFDLKYGVNLEFFNMEEDSKGIPFVARTEKNNGVVGRVKLIGGINPNPPNTISVSCGGSVMASFLQEEPYYSGFHVLYLTPKIKLDKRELLYYCMCLKQNAWKYSYGRQANKTLKNLEIPPKKDIPPWVYSIKIQELEKKPLISKEYELNIKSWKWFKISDLFIIKGTKHITAEDILEYRNGNYPFIVTSSRNNGVEGFYDYFTEESNVLTIDSATVGTCFYQGSNFSASDHVEKLIPQFNLNKFNALFLTTIINLEKIRYGYGRKFSQKRISETKIKLPVDKNGNPDWEFMENYIKSLNYSKELKWR